MESGGSRSMSEYKDDDKELEKNQSKEFIKEHESTPEGLRINSVEKTLKRQETLNGIVWNNSVQSVLEEKKKMIQERITPGLKAYRDQRILKPSMLEDLKVSVLSSSSPVIGLEGLKNQATTLLGEGLMRERMLGQSNFKISSGLSALKEASISSVSSTIKQQTMKRQEVLSGGAWNNSIESVFEEQKNMMQKGLAPALNAFRDQGITMVPKTSMLEDLKVSVLSTLSPVIGLKVLKNETATLLGEGLMREEMIAQNNWKTSLGFSALKQAATNSLTESLKQQTTLIREDWNSTLGVLGQQAIGFEKLNQSYLKTVSGHLRSDLHSLSGLDSISMASSVAIKGIYESAVNDIENLYKEVVDEKVENNPDLDIELSDKEFLEEFIMYCKRIGSMLNTLNSSVIWDILQKIVVIHSLYSMITGTTDGYEINEIDNLDITPIEERNEYKEEENLPKEKHDYEIDIEKDMDNIDIDAGMRT